MVRQSNLFKRAEQWLLPRLYDFVHNAVTCLIGALPDPRFAGSIVEFDGINKHRVVYDDGDEDWYDLSKENVKLQTPSEHCCFETYTDIDRLVSKCRP